MSRDFDFFPTYDIVIKDDVYLSNIWSDFMATFVETLREYLSQNGMFVPVLTVSQQAQIQTPQEGQMVYIKDASSTDTPNTSQLQIWKLTDGVGEWTVIV